MNAAVTPGTPGAPALDLIVVGAGLSGLVAAHRAQRAGLQVRVIDAAPRAGGVIGSVQRDDFLFERGPNSAMDTSPLIGELIAELGLQSELRWASAASNKRYVVRDGKLIPLADVTRCVLQPHRCFPWVPNWACMAEVFKGPSDPALEESIAAFVRRRLGRRVPGLRDRPLRVGHLRG
jgi:oxygen-dependent protoporphyrinogen oxidase